MKKSFLLAICFVLSLAILPNLAHTQPPPDPGGDPDTGEPGVPLDGGLSILLAGGVAYGAKKIRDARKNYNK